MKKISCTLLFALVAFPLLNAAEAPKTQEKPVSQAAPAEVPAVELKNRSSFVMDESGRNPFWPIGWKPAAKISANDRVGPEVLPTSFVVSSIVLDTGAKFAIVNGKTMQEGQVFGLQLGNQTYQITVKSIEDGRVVFARRDEEIEVLLRRR